MRFLIGIFTGAILTLFIATAVDAPTDPVLASATDRFHGAWDSLIEATSNTLFRNPESAQTDLIGNAQSTPAPVAEGVATPDAPASTDAEPEFDNQQWFLETEASTPAAFWEPFHSQMSAEGFADRLSRELGYPLRVQREGPGAYRVVFEAESSSRREELLARIAEITGQ